MPNFDDEMNDEEALYDEIFGDPDDPFDEDLTSGTEEDGLLTDDDVPPPTEE